MLGLGWGLGSEIEVTVQRSTVFFLLCFETANMMNNMPLAVT
jgi:hypothetical protein